MKIMKSWNEHRLVVLGAVASLLSACGGGKGSAATPAYGNPNNPYNYNQQVNQQGYHCQAGWIQLRNAFGNPQCYSTTNLADACSQAGGSMSQGNLCRRERKLPGSMKYRFKNLYGSSYPARMPLQASLFGGEALRVYGTIDPLNEASDWSAQLIQQGQVVGSASSSYSNSSSYAPASIYDRPGSAHYFSITALSTAYSPGSYAGQGVQPNPYNSPYVNGQYSSGYMNTATPQAFTLEILFSGRVDIRIQGAAISCEDGHGNSYPCQ